MGSADGVCGGFRKVLYRMTPLALRMGSKGFVHIRDIHEHGRVGLPSTWLSPCFVHNDPSHAYPGNTMGRGPVILRIGRQMTGHSEAYCDLTEE